MSDLACPHATPPPLQGVYNIISGTYPSTDKDAVQLAAWQFQAKFGAHNPASHRAGFLSRSIQEYVPAPHLHAVPTRPTESWEDDIFRKHAFSTTQIPREAYLSALSQRDYYGAVLFVVKQSYTRAHPKKLFLGISRRGILLLRIPKTPTDGVMETLAKYPLADIYRWAYKPSVNFYFEIKAEDSTDEVRGWLGWCRLPRGVPGAHQRLPPLPCAAPHPHFRDRGRQAHVGHADRLRDGAAAGDGAQRGRNEAHPAAGPPRSHRRRCRRRRSAPLSHARNCQLGRLLQGGLGRCRIARYSRSAVR